ncbi:MAG TPA: sigma-70 family RNA polymerase sigma factor, partial [Solirubrobacteraceae bacterium]|nr:sigma-70 family RNA polymerase sigma factor [Solirubrobacteraceae bacterium]
RSALTDVQLADAYRAGDEQAFAVLHDRYRAQLLRYAGSVLRGQGDGIAEDVVQEAMLRAGRALRREPGIAEVRPWLYRLVRNCALDELSRAREAAARLVADQAHAVPIAPEQEPPAAAERRQRLRDVLADVADLSPVQRHALLRRAVDGVTHAELALELGITEEASKGLVHRARAGVAARGEARSADCSSVRSDLLGAADERRRASTRTYRHLASCGPCRAFRASLRAQRRALALLPPLPAGLAVLASAKLAFAGKVSAGGGKATAAAAGALAAGAAGLGTVTFLAGDPAPVAVRSPAVGPAAIAAGEPLPRGTAVVRRTVELRPGTDRHPALTLACPPRLRVADLLPLEGARLTASYASGVDVGVDRTAVVRFDRRRLPRTVRVDVSILCKRPGAHDALVPRFGLAPGERVVHARTAAPIAARPGGETIGSLRPGEPVRVAGGARAASTGWVRVRTELGARGWVRAGALRQR